MTGLNGSRVGSSHTGAVVRRRRLGQMLRDLREAAGFTLERAAPLLDWSASKLSRIEVGEQSIDVHGVRSMLDLYDAAEQWDELIALTRQTRQKGWWRTYGMSDKGYVPLEAEASSVRDVTIGFVPGLLQTEDYARHLFLSAVETRSDEHLKRIIAVRMHRQERLVSDDNPLRLHAILDQAALHRRVGDAVVMREQFARLVEAAALSRVTLQVVPFSAGPHPAITSGFTLLAFDGIGMPDMAYVEHPAGAVHIAKEQPVARARLAFDRLRTLALSPDDSVELVERVATTMR